MLHMSVNLNCRQVQRIVSNPQHPRKLHPMATSHLNCHSTVHTLSLPHDKNLPAIFTYSRHKHRFQITIGKTKRCLLSTVSDNSAFLARFSSNEGRESNVKFSDILKDGFPRGSWWNLRGDKREKSVTAEPITIWISLRRMWTLIGHDQWILYVAIVALIVASVSEISMPSVLAASIFSAQRGEVTVFSSKLRVLAILFVSSGISSGLRSGCFSVANVILVKRLRETLYSALLFQDMSFYDTEEVGGLTSRLGADCQQLSNVIGNNIHLILRNSLQGLGAIINLLVLSWPLTLSALVISSILSTVFLVNGRYQQKAARLTQDFNASASNVAEETISLMRTVRVCGTEQREVQRYKKVLDKLAYVSTRVSMAYGFWNMNFTTLYRSTQVFAVLLGGMSIISGHVSAEQLTKYVLYCEWLIYATWRVVENLSSLLQCIGASERVFQLVDFVPSNQFVSQGMKRKRLLGHVQFVNVSFHYPSRVNVPVLDHVCLSIEAKEVVAIVGSSGSGKSTLVKLLLGLYEPIGGQIYIDGLPLRELDIRWLRENIGFVEQEPHLFHTDMESNIRYGCQRDIKHEDVERAAKHAHAHGFISSLPYGYNTLVDDNLLSGGQKQRIAIARAILRDPAILILDEATSALDAESEHYIKVIIDSLGKDSKSKRTIIVIAHRLSTVKAADKIVVMDDGRIVEMGGHTELLHKDGFYAQLVRIQTEILT